MISVLFTRSSIIAAMNLSFSLIVGALHAQSPSNFNFSLGVDYSAAEQTLDFFERRVGDADRIANLRGNQLAAATSVLVARTEKSNEDFRDQLVLARDIARFESDIYGFLPAKNHLPELQKLLSELKRRQLDRRIVATIASYFPAQSKISTRFSIYFVVVGNERTSAFVRHVVWNYDTPTFVGDEEGEPVIVVNLARVVEGLPTLQVQFIEVLSITAHECFHAAFSVLKKSLPVSSRPKNIIDQLIDLVQNEGMAYYLSQQTHYGGETPAQNWFLATSKSIGTLNRVFGEMSSPNLTRAHAQELLMNANLSGSFEGNYGATAGLRMAYEIDSHLGRQALTATLMNGGRSFILAYHQACMQDGSLPQIDRRVLQALQTE
jgi:hypothetical protein